MVTRSSSSRRGIQNLAKPVRKCHYQATTAEEVSVCQTNLADPVLALVKAPRQISPTTCRKPTRSKKPATPPRLKYLACKKARADLTARTLKVVRASKTRLQRTTLSVAATKEKSIRNWDRARRPMRRSSQPAVHKLPASKALAVSNCLRETTFATITK